MVKITSAEGMAFLKRVNRGLPVNRAAYDAALARSQRAAVVKALQAESDKRAAMAKLAEAGRKARAAQIKKTRGGRGKKAVVPGPSKQELRDKELAKQFQALAKAVAKKTTTTMNDIRATTGLKKSINVAAARGKDTKRGGGLRKGDRRKSRTIK